MMNERKNIKKYKKCYIGALYGYAVTYIDQLLKRTWEAYFNKQVFGEGVNSYYFDRQRMEIIDQCIEYLNEVLNLTPEVADRRNIKDKPNYFDIRYRLAQTIQIKGIVLVLRNQERQITSEYFAKAVEYADDVLDTAKRLKEQKVHGFMSPNHVLPIKAISLYFLEEPEKSLSCFQVENLRAYILMDEARLLVLYGKYEEALDVLHCIPQKETIYGKAVKLAEKVEERIS